MFGRVRDSCARTMSTTRKDVVQPRFNRTLVADFVSEDLEPKQHSRAQAHFLKVGRTCTTLTIANMPESERSSRTFSTLVPR